MHKSGFSNRIKRYIWLPVILLLEVFVLAGCKKDGTKIVLTTGFDEDVVFKIEDITCTKSEVMVYLVNIENVYDEVFGTEIWEVPYEEGNIESQYKESILARLAQIKAMNLLAREKGIELTDAEKTQVKRAASEYFDSLNETEKEFLLVDEAVIEKMYEEYAIANKLYETVTDAVNAEISDDEARAVTVRSILIKTYSMDSNGNRVEYDSFQKNEAMKKIYELAARIKAGEEFEILQADYNEDEKSLYSFARGVMPEKIEETAFNLAQGEVSDVIQTEYGYHIIKCIKNFDEEQTDANKENIVQKRKQQAFTEEYDSFISSLTSNINMELWDSISYSRTGSVGTTRFFETYDRIFKSE